MSEHVLDWLGAYLDGELRGDRQRQVEAHLAACAGCRSELQALRALSTQLQFVPAMPSRTPADQFVAQVRLRLPPRAVPPSGRARVRQAAGLWLPLGVVGLWALGQAALLLAGLALSATGLPSTVQVVDAVVPVVNTLGLPPAWGGVLVLLVLDVLVSAVAAALGAGSLAAWWSARDIDITLPVSAGSETV